MSGSGVNTTAETAVDESNFLFEGELLDGGYRVDELVCSGAMGAVYRGRQLKLDRNVAIKVIRPDLHATKAAVKRFEAEAKVIQRLTHPNTVRLYDHGQTEAGLPYLVMEFLEGSTLDRVLAANGPLPANMVCDIASQVLKCLIEAHTHGIVHRDIKPSNLMLCRQVGASNFIKLIDFGVARKRVETPTQLTLPGTTLGTPAYMAPEQLQGFEVDGRADLYSLGLTMFELVTGTQAYSGANLFDIAQMHLSADQLVVPLLPNAPDLQEAIMRAVRKHPEERFQSAIEMLAALTGEVLSGNLSAAEVSVEVPSTLTVPVQRRESGAHDRTENTDPIGETPVEGVWAEGLDDEELDELPRPRRAVYLALVVLPCLLLGAALVFAFTRGDRDRPSEVIDAPIAAVQEPTIAPRIQFEVRSEPSGAAVLLDGDSVCRTPCSRELVANDVPRVLTVTLDGHEDFTRAVTLGEDVLLPVALVPLAQPADQTPAAAPQPAESGAGITTAEADGDEPEARPRERRQRRRSSEAAESRRSREADDRPTGDEAAPSIPVNF